MTSLQYYQSQAGNSIGDFISAVLKIDNDRDARRFYEGAIKSLERYSKVNNPKEIVNSNIGWVFGEGMSADRIMMWCRVSGAAHPVFGTTLPTPAEAFKLGLQMGGYNNSGVRPR